jgi:murein DD-endopeptidase MepM/ murein hydrolase activator NlpD
MQMNSPLLDLSPTALMNRRGAVLGAIGLLALPAMHASAASAANSKAAKTKKQPVPDVWPHASQVPGGVARLSLGPAAVRPNAFAGDVPLLVLGDPIEWTALVGIPLAAEPGEASIAVRAEGKPERQVAYTVAPKQYREQRLTVAPRTVDLSPGDEARYVKERDHLTGVMATLTDLRADAVLQMSVPVPGRRSSSFGLRRVFNGQSRNPHSGMDISCCLKATFIILCCRYTKTIFGLQADPKLKNLDPSPSPQHRAKQHRRQKSCA